MASVQDLIQLAEHESRVRNPGVSAISNALLGYQQAQEQSLARAKMMIELEEQRKLTQRMEEEDRQARAMFEQQRENSIKQGMREVSPSGRPVLPKQRLEVTISPNAKGLLSRNVKVIDTSEENKTPGSIDAILAARVGRGEMTLEEAIDMKAKASPASVQFVGTQGGQPVLFNPKTRQMETGKLPGKGPLISTTQSEGQANAKLYSDRSEQAHTKIDELSSKIDLASFSAGAQSKLPNVAKSKEVQMYEQAQRNFINAILRRESGAVISPSEFAEGRKQYFPQFGDSPEVIQQKKENRETAIAGLKNAAGIIEDDGGTMPDVTKMSDEELRRIANGE